MPNWCSTTIVFHGDEHEITEFHKKIKEWTSKSFMPNSFGKTWLGNILCWAELQHRIGPVENRLRCRGSVEYIGDIANDGDGDYCFKIDTETAWGPMLLMWKPVIDKLGYKSIGFSFQSEEPGMGEYFMFDPYEDFEWIVGDIEYIQLMPEEWTM